MKLPSPHWSRCQTTTSRSVPVLQIWSSRGTRHGRGFSVFLLRTWPITLVIVPYTRPDSSGDYTPFTTPASTTTSPPRFVKPPSRTRVWRLTTFCRPSSSHRPFSSSIRYFSEIFQFWMHTSLFGSLGPMGFVFNTPSHHRVHHGRNAYCIDRNFGGVLIIWDRMFGTFEAERKEEPPVYGLIRPEQSFNQLWLQFHTLKELLCDKWRLKDEKGESVFPGWTDKVKALFFPPGWMPKARVRLFFHWASLDDHTLGVPLVELPVQKYNPPLSPWLKGYCFVHFLLLLCIFLHFEYDRGQLGYVDFSLKIAFFVCTMQSFGAFFDKKKFAPFLEIFRSIGVIAYYATRTIIERRGGIQPNRIFMAALFAVSAIALAVKPLRDLARRASKVTPKREEAIGTVRKEFANGENGIAEVTDKTTETKRNGVDMDMDRSGCWI
uniref:Alkylglycerol monooxygenase n=1 Tax=Globodera rostochiensis TaxID=31243 RepID=A0A914I069_GLORO